MYYGDHRRLCHSAYHVDCRRLASSRTAVWRTANGAPYEDGEARSTRSHGASEGSNSTRTSSRKRRLTVLRATAVLSKRGTTIATRLCPSADATDRTSNQGVRSRVPSARTRRISAPRVSRHRRGKLLLLGASVLGRKPHGEALAALFATAAQDFAPPLGLHPRPKSVCADAPRIARPICRLAHRNSRNDAIYVTTRTLNVVAPRRSFKLARTFGYCSR
jgi:hypothetical protein